MITRCGSRSWREERAPTLGIGIQIIMNPDGVLSNAGGSTMRRNQKLAARPFRAHISFVLPDETPTPEQIAIFRQMTPERRLSLAEQLYWTARELKAAWLRARHPEWTEQQIS